MWKPVTIKPNDQSFKNKIVQKDETLDEKIKILRVGDYSFYGKAVKGGRESIYLLDDWLIWEEDKPKKLLAPAYVKWQTDGRITVSLELFESLSEARDFLKETPSRSLYGWPALLNKDGYYEVSE